MFAMSLRECPTTDNSILELSTKKTVDNLGWRRLGLASLGERNGLIEF